MNEHKFNITYILGAGASAKSLPTVRGTNSVNSYANSLRSMAEKIKPNEQNVSWPEVRQTFFDDLIWLADNADKHGTPDTFAKFCYLKNDFISLVKIKETLALYFTIEQFIEKKVDSRYFQFLTSIIDGRRLFPSNVKILNWNYDFQLQIAAENYWLEEYHIGITSVHRPPFVTYYPSLGNDFNVNYEKDKSNYSMIHLNGIAGFYHYLQNNHILNYYINGGLKDIDNLFDKFHTDKKHKDPLLTFAFEKNLSTSAIRNRILYAGKVVEKTDCLVIIGYSFPNDNVETDEKIMEVIKSGNLKEIHYQDPYNDGSFIRSTFNIDNSIPIIHQSNCEAFYIPRQLKLKMQ